MQTIASRERRSRRSPWASEALHLQLLRAVQDHSIQTLTLSDALGQVWAASSREPFAAPPGPGPRSDEGPDFQRDEREGKPLLIRRLRVGPATLYLAAQGPSGEGQRALKQAAAGVERILGGLI